MQVVRRAFEWRERCYFLDRALTRSACQLGRNASESEKLALAQKKVAAQSEIVEKQIANLEKTRRRKESIYGMLCLKVVNLLHTMM